MEKQAKLSISPDDSKNENFTLSLVDFFHKELALRGINAAKKASFLEISLPNIYEEKYSSVIVDCSDGKVYLRGKECKDKPFGKLSKFNPQRKSDAYNCVNYSVTRLVNRINKLFASLEEKPLDIRTANFAWIKELNEEPQVVIWVDDDPSEIGPSGEMLINFAMNECIDFTDLREENVLVLPVDDAIAEKQVVEIDLRENDVDVDDKTKFETGEVETTHSEFIVGPFDNANLDAEPVVLEANNTIDNVDELVDKYLDFSKTAGMNYIHYFPSNQPEIDAFLEEHPNLKQLQDQYGKCTNFYNKEKRVTYENYEEFPENEVKHWCILWDNIVENRFMRYVEKYKETRKSDVELNDNIITVYRNKATSPNDEVPDYASSYKELFEVKMKGNKTTVTDYDGNVLKTSYSPDDEGITFEYGGIKY